MLTLYQVEIFVPTILENSLNQFDIHILNLTYFDVGSMLFTTISAVSNYYYLLLCYYVLIVAITCELSM